MTAVQNIQKWIVFHGSVWILYTSLEIPVAAKL